MILSISLLSTISHYCICTEVSIRMKAAHEINYKLPLSHTCNTNVQRATLSLMEGITLIQPWLILTPVFFPAMTPKYLAWTVVIFVSKTDRASELLANNKKDAFCHLSPGWVTMIWLTLTILVQFGKVLDRLGSNSLYLLDKPATQKGITVSKTNSTGLFLFWLGKVEKKTCYSNMKQGSV